MNIGRVLGFVAVAACAALAGAQPTALVPPENGPRRVDTGWHSLWNATVHVKPGEILEHATVVIRDGKIEAVLKGEGDAAGPKPMGPRIWDCTGLHVYAGFIDPYVEVEVPRSSRDEAGAHWNGRVTPQRKATDSNGPDEATRQTLRSLGFVAAGISPRAGIFRGTGAVVSLRKPAETAAGSPPAVYVGNAFHALGFDQQDESREAEAIWGGYPNSQMGAIAVVRQTLLDSQWQAEARKRGEAIAPNCVDVLAKGVGPEMMVFDAQDELDVLRIAKIAKEFDRKMVVVGTGTEYQRYAPIAQDGLFLIEPLRYPKAPEVGTPGEQEAIELKTMMEWEAAPFNLSRLENAGIKCCVTTARLKDRKQFDEALRLAMKAGITADVALAMVTTRPAALMGVAGQLGTIETGKIASLMVTDQDYFATEPGTGPGAGPAAAVKKWKPAKVRDVWIDGVRHEITPRPEQELAGSWDVKLVGAPGQRTLEIAAGNEIKVTKMWEDAATNKEHAKARETKAEKVLLDNGRLTFQFDHEPLGDSGVFVMSAMVRDGSMVGVGTRSDGKVFQWSAARKAPALKGSWAFVYDNNAAAETLVFDADNGLQVVDSVGKSSTPKNLKFNGEQLSYTLIEPGITRGILVEAELDAEASPRVLKGVTINGDARTQWTASESLPTGTWRVFEADGQQRDVTVETGLWIVITDNSLTLRFVRAKKEDDTSPGKFKTVTIKADDFKVDGTTITFKHDFKALGAEGSSTDTVTVRGNELIGESTLADGSKHTYKARRDVKAEPYEDKDAWRIAGTPLTLPVPFGPYGVLSYPVAKNVIVTGATIWTSSEAGVIEGGTLIVRNGKISAVLKAGVEIPAGVGGEGWTLIDGKGKHVTAGIIDCHSHTGISRGVNESGEAVTAEVRIQDVTNPDSVNWYRQLGGGVTTVNSLHGSVNAIGGQNCVNKIRWGAARPDDMHFAGAIPGIKFALGENPKGSNGPRSGTRYPQSRMGVETLIRDRFIAADEYRKAKAAGTLVRTDLELEPLAQVLDGTRLVHAHSYRQDEIVMLAMVAKDFGFKIGTYQHILEGYKVAEVIREHAIGASGFADWWAYKVEVQDAIPQGLPLMSKQGVNVSFNSDSDEMARRLNIEAGKGVKYGGLTEVEALKFITINPAIQLKIDSKVGSLEAGKDADFVIWSRAPLSGLAKCEATYIEGAEMFSLAKDVEAREEIKRERSRLIQKLLVGAKTKDKKDGDEPEGNTKTDPKLRDHYAELMRGGHYPGSNLPGECGCGE